MLRGKIIAVCSESHTKSINTMYEQKIEFLKVKAGDTYSDNCTAKCVKPFKQYHKPELYMNTQSVPRSKHSPSLLQKPVT